MAVYLSGSDRRLPGRVDREVGPEDFTYNNLGRLSSPGCFEIDATCFDRGIDRGLNGVQIVPNGHLVLMSVSLAIFDADETQLADTLEHFHDGIRGRFARAVLQCLADKGLQITPEQLDENGFWSGVRKDLSGQTEEAWEVGLAERVGKKFNVTIEVADLKAAMREVLSDSQVGEFADLVKPVGMIYELLAALDKQGVPRHLCTTTKREIIGPLLNHYMLLKGVKHLEFGAEKKVKDPAAPGGQVFRGVEVERSLRQAGVKGRTAVMFGDSIADWGTAAVAGVGTVVLRPANFLVTKLGGYEGAALELKEQVERAIFYYPQLAQTKVVIVAGFDNVRVLPMRKNVDNQRSRPAIVWTGELKS